MPHTSTCRPKEVAVSNPNHYMQTEERGINGNSNEIEMDGNPAYATCGVQCTADQGEVIHCMDALHQVDQCLQTWHTVVLLNSWEHIHSSCMNVLWKLMALLS